MTFRKHEFPAVEKYDWRLSNNCQVVAQLPKALDAFKIAEKIRTTMKAKYGVYIYSVKASNTIYFSNSREFYHFMKSYCAEFNIELKLPRLKKASELIELGLTDKFSQKRYNMLKKRIELKEFFIHADTQAFNDNTIRVKLNKQEWPHLFSIVSEAVIALNSEYELPKETYFVGYDVQEYTMKFSEQLWRLLTEQYVPKKMIKLNPAHQINDQSADTNSEPDQVRASSPDTNLFDGNDVNLPNQQTNWATFFHADDAMDVDNTYDPELDKVYRAYYGPNA